MSKRARTLLIITVLLFILVPVGSIGACEFRIRSLQTGYDELKVGDPSHRVIELMGSPSTVEPCFNEPNCTSLTYYALFERWIIYVDSNNQVIDKINNEGSF